VAQAQAATPTAVQWFRTAAGAERAGVSRWTLLRAAARGEIAYAILPGGGHAFRDVDLDQWAERRREARP
jgi:hypothetical protein